MSHAVAKNSVFTLIANLSLAASNWLLLVIITKHFSSRELGEVVLSLSIISPLFLLSSFKLRTLMVVDLEREFSVYQYFSARFLANTLMLATVPFFWLLFLSDVNAIIFFIIASYRWCDAWCELSYSYFHRINRFSLAASSQTIRSITAIVVLLACAVFGGSLVLSLGLWLFVTVVFAANDLRRVIQLESTNASNQPSLFATLTRVSTHKTSIELYKKYFTVSIAIVMVSLYVFIPNLVIKAIVGVEAAGQFAVISYFLVAGSVLITSLSQAASPHLSQLLNKGLNTQFFKLVFKLCALGFLVGALGLLFTSVLGSWLLQFIYNTELSQFHRELNWIMAAAMMRYSYIFLGTAMNSFKLFNYQTQIYSFGTLSVLILCLALVPLIGTQGAAIAMFLSTCIEFVLFLLRFHNIRKSTIKSEATI